MQFILNLEDFLLNEMMSISDKVDTLSKQIFSFLNGKTEGVYYFIPNIIGLDISTIMIYVIKNNQNVEGFVNLDYSKQSENGWIFCMALVENCKLYHVQHECNHIWQILNKGKGDILKKMNYVKSDTYVKNLNIISEDDLNDFFMWLYLCESGEIDSMVNETYAYLKSLVNRNGITTKLKREEFEALLSGTKCYKKAIDLINYDIYNVFDGVKSNDINKFFYLLEQNKKKLDLDLDNPTTTNNYPSYYPDFLKNTKNYIYPKPDKDIVYYDNFIRNRGEYLKRKLLKLSSHFCV